MLSDLLFEGFAITKIKYEFVEEDLENSVGFAYRVDNDSNMYELSLFCKIIDSDRRDNNTLFCEIGLTGKFTFANDGLSSDEKMNFIKNNGSAILFPYLRSLVHTITGFDTTDERFTLPAINIYNMIEQIDRNLEKELIENPTPTE